MITKDLYKRLIDIRAHAPEKVLELARKRRRRPLLLPYEQLTSGIPGGTRLFLLAADHPARGVIGVGGDPLRMADRRDLLSRLSIALSHPGVDGLLATPDIIEDLLLLGSLTSDSSLLDDKVVFGSMNPGGLAGSAWQLDDPITAYHAAGIYRMNLDGGKLLLRIDPNDPASLKTITYCARAIRVITSQRVPVTAMLEPLPAYRDENGALRIDTSPEALIRVIAIASGIGPTSAHTWLKLPPPTSDPMTVFAASTLPVLLGGDPGDRGEELLASWEEAMEAPTVRGLVAGRSLIYPADDDVKGWVDRAARIVHPNL